MTMTPRRATKAQVEAASVATFRALDIEVEDDGAQEAAS